ncbi:MAG TPA: hypothetical protein DEF43_20365 [Chloroflexus aurantiacus]|uniref:Uncharacterized protein n=1 Tax=Chloroflexus aurantiacus (strain ATCC 29366 / DSM 635 / J-10-fl) TaxID=324602 RepID=A9WGH1_CHLAA|nr:MULTISPECIES: hypothetical protein [Chloroflexus]ABY35503.1 conserved hypothetical protein [Chloroflexus aurantiacus J-10-fl]GIV92053.1 MAG: hypothetical protein KatS3mg056_0762 [Chloroflexus sp.]HBW69456.1 hypothetical protein [Chloroflexus aurantiacus]
MRKFTDNPRKNAHILREIDRREEKLVQMSRDLADKLAQIFENVEKKPLSDKDHKERQLRNIQAVAEQSPSWLPVELFIRYQAARKEIYIEWAEEANSLLDSLRSEAQSIVGTDNSQLVGDVHMELVRRTLGYTVRWHVWDAKGTTQREVKQ